MNELDFKLLVNPNNTASFTTLLFENQLSKLREIVFLFLINRKSEDEYLDISKQPEAVLQNLYQELREMGWKYALSFGDTGLFIFKEKKPKTCW